MALAIAGCGGGGETPTPPEETTTELLREDFSDNSAGWIPGGRFEGDNTILEIIGGRMSHFVKTAEGRGGVDTTGLEVANAAELESLGDVSIEVRAERTTNPEDHFYGITCRQVDFDNFYGFVIVEGGSFSIFRIENKVTTELATGNSPAISTGEVGTNLIRADCVGDSLTMFIDGQQVAQTSDSTFASGAVGFLVETRGVPGLEVFYDDLVIRAA